MSDLIRAHQEMMDDAGYDPGPTPDTGVTLTNSWSGGSAFLVAVYVVRGRHASTPVEASTSATGTTAAANPPSVTPTTAGAKVLAVAAAAADAAAGAYNWTPPAWGNLVVDSFDPGNDATGLIAFLAIGLIDWTSGALDPAAVSTAISNTAHSWAARSLALRPA